MKRPFQHVVMLSLAMCFLISCATLTEHGKKEYGVLGSAVTFSADKVKGEYGDAIPDDFDSRQFMELVRGKIPENYYRSLKKYELKLEPRGPYYLLEVFDKQTMVLFDYSCSFKLDGPILFSEEKFDLDNLDKYDPCR